MPLSYLPPQAEEGDTRLRGNDELETLNRMASMRRGKVGNNIRVSRRFYIFC